MTTVNNAFPYFAEAGTNGYIYIGAANQDAQTNPITVYRDAALTLPWSQPIRTLNGYPAYQGAQAEIYTAASSWSITVKNANQQVVSRDTLVTGGAGAITFTQAGTGAVSRTVQAKLREYVSVKDFGAVGDGVSNDTPAFMAAFETGKAVYVPAGTYAINMVVPNRLQMFGEHNQSTVLVPFDITKAAVRVAGASSEGWSYAFLVENIRFRGKTVNSKPTGIGVSFGMEEPSQYIAGDEMAQPAVFRNVKFTSLKKGVNCSAGNIGIEFYSCNWQACHYGTYAVDARFGGVVMHSGCKYYYGGEFDNCQIGVFLVSNTAGFGGVAFYSTIFEYNSIDFYCQTNDIIQPVLFCDVWSEGSGRVYPTGTPPKVEVDSWNGQVKSTILLDPYSFIFDGIFGSYLFTGGQAHDVHVMGENIKVHCRDTRIESLPPYGGESFVIDNPDTSYVTLERCISVGGTGTGKNVICTTAPHSNRYTNDPTVAQNRVFNVPARLNKLTGSGIKGTSVSCEAPLSTPATLPHTITQVNDGRIYPTCNNVQIGFGSLGQFVGFPELQHTITGNKYCVVSVDVKGISGDAKVYVGNLSDNQLFSDALIRNGEWNTIAGIALSKAGTIGLSLTSATGIPCEVRLSAYQCREFDTLREAMEFIEAGIYVTP